MDEIKFLSVQHPALCQRTLLSKEQQLPSFFLHILQSLTLSTVLHLIGPK